MKRKLITNAKKALAVFMATLFLGMIAPVSVGAASAEKNFIIDYFC